MVVRGTQDYTCATPAKYNRIERERARLTTPKHKGEIQIPIRKVGLPKDYFMHIKLTRLICMRKG